VPKRFDLVYREQMDEPEPITERANVAAGGVQAPQARQVVADAPAEAMCTAERRFVGGLHLKAC
jgi:hypothetical protein